MRPAVIVTLLCVWGLALSWFPGLRGGWTGFLGGGACLGLIYHWATQSRENSSGRDTAPQRGEQCND